MRPAIALLVVGLGVFGLPARADDEAAPPALVITNVQEASDGLIVRAQIDLAPLRPGITAAIEKAVREKLEPLLRDFQYGNFRFTNLRAEVGRVGFARSSGGEGVVVETQVRVRADRARRRYALFGPWHANGWRDLATIDVDALARPSAAGSRMLVQATLGAITVTGHLTPFHGARVRHELGNQVIGNREVVLPGQVTFTRVSVGAVVGDVAELVLAVTGERSDGSGP